MFYRYYKDKKNVFYRLRYEGSNKIKFCLLRTRFSSFYNIKHKIIVNRLIRFIDENKIYKKINSDTDFDRVVSPFIDLKFYRDVFSIEFDINGIFYSPSIDRYTIELSNIFYDFELVDMFSENGIFNYVFSPYKTERIIFPDIDDFKFMKNSKDLIIPLNSKVDWNLNNNPHGIVAGGTGSGKTYFLYYLVFCFLLQKAELYVIDPKNTKLGTLKYLNEKINCCSNFDTLAKDTFLILRYIESEIKSRSDKIVEFNIKNVKESSSVEYDYRSIKMNPIVLIIDELMAFKVSLGKNKSEFDERLARIVMLGRQLGIFVILATQKVKVETISSDIKVNCNGIFVLGNIDSISLVQIFGSSENIEIISGNKKGVGYFSLNGEMARKIEYPYIEDIGIFDNVLKKV